MIMDNKTRGALRTSGIFPIAIECECYNELVTRLIVIQQVLATHPTSTPFFQCLRFQQHIIMHYHILNMIPCSMPHAIN